MWQIEYLPAEILWLKFSRSRLPARPCSYTELFVYGVTRVEARRENARSIANWLADQFRLSRMEALRERDGNGKGMGAGTPFWDKPPRLSRKGALRAESSINAPLHPWKRCVPHCFKSACILYAVLMKTCERNQSTIVHSWERNAQRGKCHIRTCIKLNV